MYKFSEVFLSELSILNNFKWISALLDYSGNLFKLVSVNFKKINFRASKIFPEKKAECLKSKVQETYSMMKKKTNLKFS